MSVYSFGFLVIFLIAWGTISEIDTTISASGKITTVVPNVEVQSNYNSVVKEILVKKGESIDKGDPLVIFDATLQKADRMKLDYQLTVVDSKIDRLKKQSLLRTDVSVGNPTDERQSKIFKDKKDQAIYGVVHGGCDHDLRRRSCELLGEMGFDGYAIGGSLGKTKEDLYGIGWIKEYVRRFHKSILRTLVPDL